LKNIVKTVIEISEKPTFFRKIQKKERFREIYKNPIFSEIIQKNGKTSILKS
jgi:hypothetical protein